MVKVVSNFLMMKKSIKEFEKALSNGDKEQLLKIGNVLIMHSDNLALEVLSYAKKSK